MPEQRLRDEIAMILREWLESTGQRAMSELKKLTDDEQRSPLTYNHYYTDNVQKSRQDAQKSAVRQAIRSSIDNDWGGKVHISNTYSDIERLMSAVESRIIVDMGEQACNEAITDLGAYYKVTFQIIHQYLTH